MSVSVIEPALNGRMALKADDRIKDAKGARKVIHNSSIFLMYMHRTQAAFLPKPIPTLTKVSILARPLAKRSSSHSRAPFSNSSTIVDPPIH